MSLLTLRAMALTLREPARSLSTSTSIAPTKGARPLLTVAAYLIRASCMESISNRLDYSPVHSHTLSSQSALGQLPHAQMVDAGFTPVSDLRAPGSVNCQCYELCAYVVQPPRLEST